MALGEITGLRKSVPHVIMVMEVIFHFCNAIHASLSGTAQSPWFLHVWFFGLKGLSGEIVANFMCVDFFWLVGTLLGGGSRFSGIFGLVGLAILARPPDIWLLRFST